MTSNPYSRISKSIHSACQSPKKKYAAITPPIAIVDDSRLTRL